MVYPSRLGAHPRSRPARLTRLVALCLLGMTSGTLPAQGLGPSTFRLEAEQRPSAPQGILEVDPGSGAASLYFPLGPGIGGPGLRYVPALVGRFAPQVGLVPFCALPGEPGAPPSAPALLVTSAFALSPGCLDLRLRSELPDGASAPAPLASWTYPDGTGGSTGGTPPAIDARAVLARFGYAPEGAPGWLPHRSGARAPRPFLLAGTGGDFLLGLAGTAHAEPGPPAVASRQAGGPGPWVVPAGLLAIRDGLAHEFRYAESWQPHGGDPPGIAHYRLAAIRNAVGEVLTFTYGPNGVDFEAAWADRKVRVTLAGVANLPPVAALDDAFSAMDPRSVGGAYRYVAAKLRIAYEGAPAPPGYTVTAATRADFLTFREPVAGGFQGAAAPGEAPLDAFRNNLQVTRIQGEAPREAVAFDYGKGPRVISSGPEGTQVFAPTVLQKISCPGQRVALEWQGRPCRRGGPETAGPRVAEETWSYGVIAVLDGGIKAAGPPSKGAGSGAASVGPGWHRVRQVRHFTFTAAPETAAPCATFIRDRWRLGGPAVAEAAPGADPQKHLPYTPGQDLPTFHLDPEGLTLVPVAGRMTRWRNGDGDGSLDSQETLAPSLPCAGSCPEAAPAASGNPAAKADPAGTAAQ